jgi:succinoglycan biosynthesis transport protein ExoP
MFLREILLIMGRRAWFLALGVVIGGLIAYWQVTSSPVLYEADAGVVLVRRSTEVKLEPRFQTSIIDELNTTDRTNSGLQTLASLVTNEAIARAVFREMQDSLPSRVATPQDLLRFISAEVRNGIIRIKARAPDPQFATDLANTWAEHYAQYVNRLYAGQVVNTDLGTQVEDARRRYQEAQAALVAFLKEDQTATLTSRLQERQATLNRLLQLRAEERAGNLQRLYERRQQAQNVLGDALVLRDLLSAPGSSAANAANTLALLSLQVNAIESGVSPTVSLDADGTKAPSLAQTGRNLQFTFTPRTLSDVAVSAEALRADLDNLIVVLQNRIAAYEAEIAELTRTSVGENASGLDPELQALFAEVASLQAQIAEQKSRREQLENERNRLWESYNLMANASQEVLLTTSTNDGTVLRFAIPASVPRRPVQAPPTQAVILGGFVGLIVAMAFVFGLELIDDRVRTRADVETVLELPVLGVVPKGKTDDGKRPIALTHPQAPVAEGVRFVRAALEAAPTPARSLLITSMGEGEGKTTVAANLAVVSAAAGLSVILVDANFRNPQLHTRFGLSDQRGLLPLLMANHANLEAHLQTTAIPGLRVLVAGGGDGMAPDWLARPLMKRIVETATNLADLVILDTSAARMFTEPLTLAGLVEGVVLVVRPGQATVPEIEHFRQSLAAVDAHLLGVVLNGVPAGRRLRAIRKRMRGGSLPRSSAAERLVPDLK